MIRNAAGQAIVAVLGSLEPKNWPECLEQLFGMLDSTDPDRQEVSDSLSVHMQDLVAIERGSKAKISHFTPRFVPHNGPHDQTGL
jgi:hypothetical protein